MIDDSFGPWSSVATPNRWDEFKIGNMEKWYDIISSCLNINPGEANSIISPTAVKLETSRATAKSKATAAANMKQVSKIPKAKSPNKKIAKQSSTSSQNSPSIENNYESAITNNAGNCNNNNSNNDSSHSFISVYYEPRDEFDTPKSFESFLSNPNCELQPWPQKYIPLDEVIGKAINPQKVPIVQDKANRGSKRKFQKKYQF
ncbi:hypothetical protein M9Y10_004823 [Tritrichomonas musculus]|uniref:Uncharacterized protein n=1 Tax=Tritrichomonas musculus TaxID=1915356 RepID=A0ABR2JJL9_9EUKA